MSKHGRFDLTIILKPRGQSQTRQHTVTYDSTFYSTQTKRLILTIKRGQNRTKYTTSYEKINLRKHNKLTK